MLHVGLHIKILSTSRERMCAVYLEFFLLLECPFPLPALQCSAYVSTMN